MLSPTHTHTHTHIRTHAQTHTRAHAHTHIHNHTHGMPWTHTYTHTLSRTNKTQRDTQKHLAKRPCSVWSHCVSFVKITVNFSPLLTPLQCPSPLSPFAPFEDIQSVISSKPVSEPHECSGLVHWWHARTRAHTHTHTCTHTCTHAHTHTHTWHVGSRNEPHTPCKLQQNSALNASDSRNVLIIRIIIHRFRHRGCLRADPRCRHR